MTHDPTMKSVESVLTHIRDGDPVTIALSLLTAAMVAVAGSLASWAAKKAGLLGWRGVKASWTWAFKPFEPSGVCKVILARLDSREATWCKLEGPHVPKDRCDRKMFVVPGVRVGFLADELANSINYLTAGEKDALPLLTIKERNLVEVKVRLAIKRIEADNDAYARMEVLDALDASKPTVQPPSHTVAQSSSAANSHAWMAIPAK